MSPLWKRPGGEFASKGFVHLRIDERLIHGQVVLGWGLPLEINCLILANDRLASESGERSLYLQIIPEEMGGAVLPVIEALKQTSEIRRRGDRALIVVQTVAEASHWIESGKLPDLLVLGGVHPKPGRHPILDYIALSDDEIGSLKIALDHDVKVVCQDVWNSKPIALEDALRRVGKGP